MLTASKLLQKCDCRVSERIARTSPEAGRAPKRSAPEPRVRTPRTGHALYSELMKSHDRARMRTVR